jgi:hypothetical protein
MPQIHTLRATMRSSQEFQEQQYTRQERSSTTAAVEIDFEAVRLILAQDVFNNSFLVNVGSECQKFQDIGVVAALQIALDVADSLAAEYASYTCCHDSSDPSKFNSYSSQAP